MDEDESITMLMAMGFENLDDIRRALRIAKARIIRIKFSKDDNDFVILAPII